MDFCLKNKQTFIDLTYQRLKGRLSLPSKKSGFDVVLRWMDRSSKVFIHE